MPTTATVATAQVSAHVVDSSLRSLQGDDDTRPRTVPAVAAGSPAASASTGTAPDTGQQSIELFLRRRLPSEGIYAIARFIGKKCRHQKCDSIEEAAAYAARFDAQGLPTYYAMAAFKEREVDGVKNGKPIKRFRVQENVRAVKAYWVDLDVEPGNEKKYESQEAALDGLIAFHRGTGLPMPTLISSGSGLHCYWDLIAEVDRETWEPVAETLKTLAAKLGFKADPACTSDPARILRPVGTWNRKDPNNPRPVELIDESEPMAFEDFREKVERAARAVGSEISGPRPPVGRTAAGINQDFAFTRDFPPFSAHKVADHCKQIAMMRDTKGRIAEPHWFTCIQTLRHSIEGPPLIHEWSNGYGGYSVEDTNGKIAEACATGYGPAFCNTFEKRNPGGCDACPFKGKISSPAQLGRLHVVPTLPDATAQSGGASVGITTGVGFGVTAPISQTPIAVNLSGPVPAAQAIIQSRYTIGTHRTLHCWQGEFYAWTGSHYAVLPIPDVREILYRLGSAFSPSVKRQQVDNALDALRARTNLSNTIPSPSWIAAEKNDPPSRSLIPMMNGILNVETHTLLSKTPRFFSSYSLPFDYNPDAPSPTDWLELLSQLWGDDTESVELLQEWFGYCLTQRTEQQKALLFVGPKRGGKGTIGRVLTALLGQANVVSPRLASFGKEFGLESLIGKQLALVSDARIGAKTDLDAVAENILRVTGEDQISIPRKFRDDFTATLPTRIMVLTNVPPRFTDGSGALPSRFVVLQSEVSFFGREDHTLTQRLLTNLPGVFNWSLSGLDRLNERGYFRQPASSHELVEQIELLAAPVRAFLAEKCETGDPAAEVPIADLFAAWRGWCALNGREHPGTQQSFGRDIHSALPQVKTVQRRVGAGDRVRCFAGIRPRK